MKKIAVFFITLPFLVGMVPFSSFAAEPIDIWWPVDGVTVSGVQPFKALANQLPATSYQLFWQVDGGQLNWMPDNYQDWPHKETAVDLSGWRWRGGGPYTINFVAQDWSGKTIGTRSVKIYTGAVADNQVSTTAGNQLQTASNFTAADPANPFAGEKLFVNPNSEPKRWADSRRNWDSYNASLMDKIANQPETQWFGNWNRNLYQDMKNWLDAAVGQGAMPVVVAYNIPQRDCGGYSAGGSGSPEAYRSWIRTFADAIGSKKAVVLLEPDALANLDCLSRHDRETRYGLLRDAIEALNSKGKISVYIDAGNPRWINASEMALRLKKAGIDRAKGFSLNISNFVTNGENISYGEQVSLQVGGKHFVIETSRNGLGPTWDSQWCNPPGRALGNSPTTNTGHQLVDAYLWVKGPSGSDGYCNGGPAAGIFWPEYGLGLAQRANW